MAGKRRKSSSSSKKPAKQEVEERDESIRPIEKWEDLEAGSEEEFYQERENPTKLLETFSGTVPYNYSSFVEEEEEDEVHGAFELDLEEEEDEEEEEEGEEEEDQSGKYYQFISTNTSTDESGDWGTKRRTYYDADHVSDEGSEAEREEEQEALKLQRKQLEKLEEMDFQDEWRAPKPGPTSSTTLQVKSSSSDEEEEEQVNLSKEARLALVEKKMPELIGMTEELENLLIKWKQLRNDLLRVKKKKIPLKVEPGFLFQQINFQIMHDYLMNLAIYCSMAASHSAGLKHHPVVSALVDCKNKLERVENLANNPSVELLLEQWNDFLADPHSFDQDLIEEQEDRRVVPEIPQITSKKGSGEKKKRHRKRKRNLLLRPSISGRVEEDEEEEEKQEVENTVMPINIKKSSKEFKAIQDFMEPSSLDLPDAEAKKQRKKSLRFYTAALEQKQQQKSKLSDLGGDMDVPIRQVIPVKKKEYEERIERTSAMEENVEEAGEEIGEGEDYYDFIKKQMEKKKKEKAEKVQMIKDMRIPNPEWDDPDKLKSQEKKRKITYEIMKNKGLTPHRKKEQRNPRVKQRNKYEKAKKKLKSVIRQSAQPGAAVSYGGELTGIKPRLTKSVRFA